MRNGGAQSLQILMQHADVKPLTQVEHMASSD